MSRTSRNSLLSTIALSSLALGVAIGHVRFAPLRVAVALPLLLLLPGWTLMRATFPGRELHGPARLLLVPGLSLAATICIGVVLDTLRPGMQWITWTVALAIVATALELVAQWRARGAFPSVTMVGPSRVPLAPIVAATLAVAAFGGMLAITARVARTQRFAPFTQFWMLGGAGAAGSYTVGISSAEARAEVVSVVVSVAGRRLYRADGIVLRPGAVWRHAVFVPLGARPLRATLYRNGEPYRTVVYQQACPRTVDPLGVCPVAKATPRPGAAGRGPA